MWYTFNFLSKISLYADSTVTNQVLPIPAFSLPGRRKTGRPRLNFTDVVKQHMQKVNVMEEGASDKVK